MEDVDINRMIAKEFPFEFEGNFDLCLESFI